MSINCVSISGNLVRDAEHRQTAGGSDVLNFTLAVNSRVKDDGGNWTDKPNYIDCVMFGARAGKLAQYLAKGTKASICGRLSQNTWTAKDGSKRTKIEVVIDEIDFTTRRSGETSAPAPAQAAPVADVWDAEMPF